MNICVVGTGYVGLVSGTCFAETGNNVTCVDIDNSKVSRLNNGEIVIYEPGLETLFIRNKKQGRLHFTVSLAEGVKDADIIFLALPTPPGANGQADLQYVLKVADELGDIISSYKVIVNKSTVPVGTGDKVEDILLQKLDKTLFDVVSNPEFLREGNAILDFLKPDRIVIGFDDNRLKEENLTYKIVLEELKKQFALDYLKNKELSIKEVTYLLDYAEPSSFIRSFKRWTGETPKAYQLRFN
mgnify:CR=1 FL=1